MAVAERKVLDALRNRGFHVHSLYDLVNSERSYSEAVPVLTMFLAETEDPRLKEALVRALSVKEARGLAGPALVREFRALPYEAGEIDAVQLSKWAVANALSVVATDTELDDIAELLRDKRHGKAREMLAVALGRMKDQRAASILEEMLEDEQVAGHAIIALGNLRATRARRSIERFLDDKRTWVRKEAKKALERMNHR